MSQQIVRQISTSLPSAAAVTKKVLRNFGMKRNSTLSILSTFVIYSCLSRKRRRSPRTRSQLRTSRNRRKSQARVSLELTILILWI